MNEMAENINNFNLGTFDLQRNTIADIIEIIVSHVMCFSQMEISLL
jgi:hypothetical protein